MGSDVEIRRAVEADVDAVFALRHLMFRAMGTPAETLDDPSWQQAARTHLANAVTDADACLVVAEVDRQVVSGAIGEVTQLIPSPSCPNGRCGLLSNVATLEAFRGRGLGGQCTDAVLTWFDEQTDVTRVDLFATTAGRPIYERRGFVASDHPSMRRRAPFTGPA